jgi:hypothetical protein
MTANGLQTAQEEQGQGDAAPYGQLVRDCLPRMLSMVDRNPCSPTYGCFDRGFWHYRTLIDYAAPLHQEGALTLVIAARQAPEAPGAEGLCALARAAIAFWCTLQRRDGSFDEFYPYERSFVATAFTSYAISEALLILGEEAGAELLDRGLGALERAGHWLGRHQDVVVVNHTAGAIAALQNIHRLSGEACFARYRAAKVEELLAHQHPEGWFYEYGGADPAYLSLAVDYLAKDYRHSQDERVGAALGRALDFMVWFLHPDGSYGGEYGSRNAKYLLPHGLELLADQSAAARRLLRGLRRALREGKVVSPALMDDRYTGFFLNKYAEAWADCRPLVGEAAEGEPRGVRIFPGAGLAVVSGSRAYTVIGMSKHGVVKCYRQGPEAAALFSDTGYFAAFADGSVGTTQWLELGDRHQLAQRSGRIEIELTCAMAAMNTALPLVRWGVPFRLFLHCWGWNSALMEWFGKKVKDRMIRSRRPAPLQVKRRIALGENQLQLVDQLRLEPGRRVKRLIRSAQAGALHVASSRYWQPADAGGAGDWEANEECLSLLNQGRLVQVNTQLNFGDGQVYCQAGEAAA